MRQMVRRAAPFTFILLAGAAVACSSAESSTPASEEASAERAEAPEAPNPDAEAIREVITSAYIEGLHRNGSREDIRAGFHPDFVMKVLSDDGIVDVTIEDWIARLPEEGTSPDHTVSHRIPTVDVSGVAATARVEVLFDGEHVFTDYMSLYRFSDGWKIVGKIFNREG
ncbi:MAG: nuclear transport factor 2 family protein [Gemmatimonadota bacterium]